MEKIRNNDRTITKLNTIEKVSKKESSLAEQQPFQKNFDSGNKVFEIFNPSEGVKYFHGEKMKIGQKPINLLNLSLLQDNNNPIRITKSEYNALIKNGNLSRSHIDISKKDSLNDNDISFIKQDILITNRTEKMEQDIDINLSKIKKKENAVLSLIKIKSSKEYEKFINEKIVNEKFLNDNSNRELEKTVNIF